MTEIPEHLLQRSRERRAALGLGGDAPAAPPAASTGSDIAATAGGDRAPATAAAAAAPARVETPVKVVAPPPPHVEAALRRKKVPLWAMPVLLGLPIWAYTYVGTLEDPPVEAAGLVAEGEELYAAKCASCHGASGGGGVGPAMSGGAVLDTWPDAADHMEWIALGSADWGRPTYGAQAKPVGGGMPGFGGGSDPLSQHELLAVVMYERVEFGGDAASEELVIALDEAIASGALVLDEGAPFEPANPRAMIDEILGEYLSPEG